jgi:HAD superfamily hydrolase (TIGR01509 family)
LQQNVTIETAGVCVAESPWSPQLLVPLQHATQMSFWAEVVGRAVAREEWSSLRRNPSYDGSTEAGENAMARRVQVKRSDSTSKTIRAANVPAVLFDLDGTLIDSNYQHVSTWSQTLRDAGIVIPTWKIHRRIGMSGKSFLRELLRERTRDPHKSDVESLDKKHEALFLREISQLVALPGANEILKHLAHAGIRMAIATTGGRRQTLGLLKHLKVPSQVEIVTGDDVEKAKPSPDIFVKAAERLRIPISDCIVVGDSAWDLLAAGRKNALGVGVLSGGYGEDELYRAGAFRVYSDVAEMLEHIEQLGLPGK